MAPIAISGFCSSTTISKYTALNSNAASAASAVYSATAAAVGIAQWLAHGKEWVSENTRRNNDEFKNRTKFK